MLRNTFVNDRIKAWLMISKLLHTNYLTR